MADKSTKPEQPVSCCSAPITIDSNDTHRRCASCAAEWTRDTRDGAWKPVVKK